MSRIYTQQKKAVPAQLARQAAPAAVHTPSMVSGESSSNLDALMQAKFQQHFLDNQIPTAEAEADRIAASVSGARTPEEVKSQLGEKMGADFSNVTFHTDSSARGMADTMGARAYTSGNDVYFGSGGFDPGVAAHELVHTVQQGVVGSSMQTVSAPTGGVQMKPGGFFKKIGHGLASAGRAVKTIATLPFQMLGALHEKKNLDANRALDYKNDLAYENIKRQGVPAGLSEEEMQGIHDRTKFKYSRNPFKRRSQKKEYIQEWLSSTMGG